MSETGDRAQRKYKGSQIELDLDQMAYMRESDDKWMKLPTPKAIVLTQRKMQQKGGLRGTQLLHKYNAFCVYIVAGNLNILAYQGKRNEVEEEANRISDFLKLPIKDLFPRDEEGNIIDDDAQGKSGCMFPVVSFLLFLSVLYILT